MSNKPAPLGIFWDNSNIAFTRKQLVPKHEPTLNQSDLRIHFLNTFDFARFGRPVNTFVMVGSLPPKNDPLWKRVHELEAFVEDKFDLMTLDRSAGNKEQGVDDTLRAELLRFCVANFDNAGTVVLLTGDGAGYGKGKGFFDAMEQVTDNLNWKVELCAWDCSCHHEMRKWATNHPNAEYRDLEICYKELTFIEGGRKARTLPDELRSIDPKATANHA